MAYVGNPIDTQNTFQSLVGKRFNGDGSTTAFTLDVAPGNVLDIEVFVGNVRQDPNSAYTLSGTTLTFTGAPPSGTNNIYVVHQAKSVGTIDVPAGGVAAGSLATSVLTGQTDIGGAIADADLFLLDDGAGGTLRKTAASRIKTYVGGNNTPAMYAVISSNQSVSNDSSTVAALATEILDSDGTFDNSNYRWTPAVAGYYMLVGSVYFPGVDDGERIYCSFFINGSESNHNSIRHGFTDWSPGSDKAMHQTASTIVYLDGDDYVDWRIAQSSGDSQNASSDWTYMAGFRIAGV